LGRQEIDKNINNFAFIHIGLVQVAIKPLTRQGLNTSVFLGLRDGRFMVYQDALLGMVESSLYNGPIYFDCYPNFVVSLKDKTVSKTLELDVETYGYNMHEGAQPLVIVYRIYYKLMKTTLEPQALMESQKGKTLLLQASTSDSHVKVPTQIEWKDVKLPNRWLLKNVTESIPVQNTLEEDLDYIEQHLDGTVSINFLPYRKATSSCSARYSNPYIEKIVSPPRCSFSKFKSQENDDLRHSVDRLDNLRFTELEDRSQKLDLDKIKKSSNNSNYTNPNLDGIIKGNVINTPFYSPASQVPPTYYSTYSQPPQQRPNSPTNSDMGFFPPNMYDPQINMIRKPFVLNKEKLRQDFNSPKYENRRKEFFATFSEFLRNYIRDKYYEFMNDIQTEVNFFEWFDHYYKPKILAGRNNNSSLHKYKQIMPNSLKTKTDNFLLQKENKSTFTPRNTLTSSILSSYSHNESLTRQNPKISNNKATSHILQEEKEIMQDTISPNIQPLTKIHASDTYSYSHAYKTSHTSLNTKDKNCSHQVSNISNFPCTKIYSREPSDPRQTLHTSAQINTIKKNNKKVKKIKEEVGSLPQVESPTRNSKNKEEFKSDAIDPDPLIQIPKEQAKNRVLCYKCNRFGHYQNNCKPPKNKSKLNIPELHSEINTLKQEIQEIKNSSFQITEEQLAQEMVTLKIDNNHSQNSSIENEVEPEENCKQIVQLISQPTFKETFLNTIDKMIFQKWYTEVKIVIDKEYIFETVALLDTGADSNCIQEGLIPTKYYEKTTEKLSQASGTSLNIEFKLSNAHVCREGVCIKTTFILVRDITSKVILGNPFIALLYPIKQISEKGLTTQILGQKITFPFILPPMTRDINMLNQMTFCKEINLIYKSKIARKEKHLMFLKQDLEYKRIEEQLESPLLKQRIENFENKIKNEICANLPNAFWHRKQHIISLPYESDFNERNIPTKARPIQMNQELLEYCKKEIQELLDKGLIRKSKSPWSCSAFYVQKNAEIERGAPRLVINYKPLNTALKWIRYPIPNKKDLLARVHNAKVFSKFDMKSGFWQIQIDEKNKYKTAFTVPFGHYEWNVMPFGLKNAPSEFQNIMNDIFNPYTSFSIVYIDDVLIFSNTIEQHWKHLETFIKIVQYNGLVVSPTKIKLFQDKIRFLGHNIYQGKITPIDRAIQFTDKFPDEIKDKNQLQRFLGSLNYVSEYYQDLRKICRPLFQRLQNNPPPWTDIHTQIVRQIKKHVKTLPCLGLPSPNSFKIVETDASERGYGGILKQKVLESSHEQIVRFYSGVWNAAQQNYSTIKKEILSIVLCISKFQDDLLNKKFLVRVDCKSAKDVLFKDVENLASKQIFARWQAILSIFYFNIEYIKGESNSIPDFLTREFLQGT
jgi:hypothetical protein